MSAQSDQLKQRTIDFAVAILRLIERIPPSISARIVGNQLARSATSVGANYRATCNARSRQEFVARLGVVVEEADEAVYWLELVTKSALQTPAQTHDAHREALELRAIFAKSLGTARANLRHRTASRTQPCTGARRTSQSPD